MLARVIAHVGNVRVPGPQDNVYKDECVYSFDSPFSDQGLFVNLNTWYGVGIEFLSLDSTKSGNSLYLHELWRFVPKKQPEEDMPVQAEAPSKLAIGVEGGFNIGESKYELEQTYQLCYVNPDGSVDRMDLPSENLPDSVSMCVDAIIKHAGMSHRQAVEQWEGDTERPVSKYAEGLLQLDNGKVISNDPSTWRCEESGMSENLWMNLSTGHIGSGRRNWDGSGGTGAALRHYEETGRQFPLVVKLGTITPHGADVWSYSPEEDGLVTDPNLANHLAHWGIDIMKLEKTDKSFTEMEVDLNQQYDWSKITEAGKKLKRISGPDLIGLKNLGNSCYMNSVIQVLFHLPEVRGRYLSAAELLFLSSPEPPIDLLTQLGKLAVALCTERYAIPATTAEDEDEVLLEKYEVCPRMFKALVGRGHPEFSSGRQQDALDFFQHLLAVMDRVERSGLAKFAPPGANPTSSIFSFSFEDRFECVESRAVKYIDRTDSFLSVQVPLDQAVNIDEVESQKKRQKIDAAPGEDVKLLVPFSACLESYFAPETVSDFYSTAIGRRGLANKIARFKIFPRYLVVHLKRYYVDETWTPRKIDALVSMPETLDLTEFRSLGPRSGEILMPEAGADVQVQVQPSESVVMQLMSMGFGENACKRAALAANNDPEQATNWILTHMDDSDFNDPLPAPTAQPQAVATPVDLAALGMLTSLGFSETHVLASLKATGGNTERAADWLFSHSHELDAAAASVTGDDAAATGVSSSAVVGATDDGQGVYNLVSFVTHMGRNTSHGHYVCHLKRADGQWVLFDDSKVAVSEEPPLAYGYLYVYRRADAPDTL